MYQSFIPRKKISSILVVIYWRGLPNVLEEVCVTSRVVTVAYVWDAGKDPPGKTRFRGSCINARWSKLAYCSPSLGGRGGAPGLLSLELELELEEEGLAMGTVLGVVPVLGGVFKFEFMVGVAEYPCALLRESGSHSPFFWVGTEAFIGTGLFEEEVEDLRVAVFFSSMLSLKQKYQIKIRETRVS